VTAGASRRPRILVTGATGVIGAWAARAIAEGGGEPVGLTRGLTSVGRVILGDLANEMQWMTANLEDPLAALSAITEAGPDVIAHLASAKPWQMDAGFVERPNPPMGVNAIVGATVNVLEVARIAGVPRVVYAGSKGSYGAFAGEYGYPSYRPVPEDHPSRPTSVYGITKLAAEQLGDYYDRHLGVEFVSLRFASTYGPFKRGGGRSAAAIIGAAIEGRSEAYSFTHEELTMIKDELVFNRDVGRAVWLACQAENLERHVYNIGTGELVSISEVVDALRDVDGAALPTIQVAEESGAGLRDNPGCRFDVSAAERDLGFRAQYDLSAGLAETALVVRRASIGGAEPRKEQERS
jgi:UDP-glucose 4-epimerase